MLVVIPFHAGDKAQAVSLANWIRELGQVSEHKALICLGEHCEETGVIEPLRECFRDVSVFRPNAKIKRGDGPMGYARAANAMWQSIAWKIYFQDKCPWLWLEPDAIPTRPTWLREIETEYRAARKPFMGAMGQAQVAMLNGVAVYPASVCDFAPLALQAGDCPWDLNAAPQILKHANVSDLFHHVYQVAGEPPTFPKHKDKLTNAALFHRCKDGSLIAYLKEQGYTNASSMARGLQPSPVTAQQTTTIAREERSPSRVDDSEMLGESVDYAQRLEDEQRRRPQRPKPPQEGDRMGELVWRGGKWHTASDSVIEDAPRAERKSVVEKYKHPEKPILSQDNTVDNKEAGSANESVPRTDVVATAPPPSRDDLIRDAIAVLKKLADSPRMKTQIRKELRKQKIVPK